MKKAILVLILMMSCLGLFAQSKSDWKEIQAVEIPSSVKIYEGTTKNGNPKCWIEIEGVKVTVSPSNAKKLKEGTVKLELVKWQNAATKKFKYSTRQKGGRTSNATKDINLSGVF